MIKDDASSAAFLGSLGALLYGASQSVSQLKRVEVAVLRKEDTVTQVKLILDSCIRNTSYICLASKTV